MRVTGFCCPPKVPRQYDKQLRALRGPVVRACAALAALRKPLTPEVAGGEITATREGFKARPVLIGHGLGGLLALTLAAETHAAGVIAIDGLPVVAMAPMTREPGAGLGANVLSSDDFRAFYGTALSREESDHLYEQWAIPAPQWVSALT